jgi:hypothetical protein
MISKHLHGALGLSLSACLDNLRAMGVNLIRHFCCTSDTENWKIRIGLPDVLN